MKAKSNKQNSTQIVKKNGIIPFLPQMLLQHQFFCGIFWGLAWTQCINRLNCVNICNTVHNNFFSNSSHGENDINVNAFPVPPIPTYSSKTPEHLAYPIISTTTRPPKLPPVLPRKNYRPKSIFRIKVTFKLFSLDWLLTL